MFSACSVAASSLSATITMPGQSAGVHPRIERDNVCINLAAERRPGSFLVTDVSALLAVVVAHHKTAVQFLDRSRWREAASCHGGLSHYHAQRRLLWACWVRPCTLPITLPVGGLMLCAGAMALYKAR